MLPWYMTIVFYLMFAAALVKNYRYIPDEDETKTTKIILIVSLIAFPIVVLPFSRLMLLLRARSLHRHAELEQRLTGKTKLKPIEEIELTESTS